MYTKALERELDEELKEHARYVVDFLGKTICTRNCLVSSIMEHYEKTHDHKPHFLLATNAVEILERKGRISKNDCGLYELVEDALN